MRTRRESTRREFLRVSGRTALALGTVGALERFGRFNAFAQESGDYRALVCVFMFGGNDSNNLVVPLDAARYDLYRRGRGMLALPSTGVLPIGTSTAGEFGLHPSLSALRTFYTERRMAIVANIGNLVRPTTRSAYRDRTVPVPDQLFSHEDQIAQMQAGIPGDSSTGWGGRSVDQLQNLNGTLGFPPSLSMSGSALFCIGELVGSAGLGSGSLELLALKLSNEQDRLARSQSHQEILEMDSGMRLIQKSNETRVKAAELDEMLRSAAPGPELQTQFPNSGLGQQLKEVTRFIQLREVYGLRRQVFFCGMGGFDTHSDQLPSQAGLLATVSEAMAAFYRATEELGVAGSVTAFTESDFSRTLNPSGNGTDHAWGGHHLALGGAVQGGDMYGTFPSLQLGGPDDTGGRGAFIPTTGLCQYGATLARWFGVAEESLPVVFPQLTNFASRDVGFMG